MANATTPEQFDGKVELSRDPSLDVSGREGAFIASLISRVPTRASPDGPGDDAAHLAPGDERVISTDALVEGVHFTRAHPPSWLGWKVLAVNLSDLAAMGAIPDSFTLAAALPPDIPEDWWLRFADGMAEYARQTHVRLVGGDIVKSPHSAMFSVTCWGRLATQTALLRSRAKPGDGLWVAGSLGRSREGLRRWLRWDHHHDWASSDATGSWKHDPLIRHHLRPEPPLGVGPAALGLGATAAMDISDGLWMDSQRMARASQVDVVLDVEALSSDALMPDVPYQERLLGGEDYALLIAAPPSIGPGMEALGCWRIGTVFPTSGAGEVHLSRAGVRIEGNMGAPFQHFSDDVDPELT